jgi:5'-3' exonuclease
MEAPKPISSLDFTVGSQFMKSLHENLCDALNKIEQKWKIKIILMIDEPNEAELKIMSHIKNNKTNESHMIVSDDADVILLSAAINVKKIHIFGFENKVEKILSIDMLLNEHYIKTLCNNDDFVFVSLLLGNDYIPKLNFINIELLWKAYVGFKKSPNNENQNIMSDNKKINLDNLKKYLHWMIFYVKNSSNKRINIDDLKSKCNVQKYLEGITWCCGNYSSGTCQKYDYMYSGKSIQPINILYSLLCGQVNDVSYPTPSCGPMDKDKYLVLIMPKKAKLMIKEKYHKLIDNELSFMYEEEECEHCVNHSRKMSSLCKTMMMSKGLINQTENDNEDTKREINEIYNKTRHEISDTYKIMKTHKLSHKPINIHDAINILNSVQ